MSASQAERRGFESRLPLHFISGLKWGRGSRSTFSIPTDCTGITGDWDRRWKPHLHCRSRGDHGEIRSRALQAERIAADGD